MLVYSPIQDKFYIIPDNVPYYFDSAGYLVGITTYLLGPTN
jgi:hypothetical protein